MVSTSEHRARLEEAERLAAALEQASPALQEAAARDAGFPVRVTALEVELAVRHLRSMEEELAWLDHGRAYGTVAAIFPYDAPTVMLARLGGAALITGNRLRFSFSSQTPRTASLISDVCSPLDALEPVPAQDNREFGRGCVDDARIRVFFVSGASAVGEVYRREQHAFDKLIFAGPGGMPAAVVFEDADVGAASRFIARRAFINGGQYCTTLKKALVHRSLYRGIRERILDSVARLHTGDPQDPSTDIGPIRVERTRAILEQALGRFADARVLAGAIRGETVEPFVLEMAGGVIPDLELFGPFLVLKPFDDPQRAVKEVIQTRYGFLVAFFGSPPEPARRLFHTHFGMVHDNPDFEFTPLRLPFGGKKESGWILERQGERWLERDGAFLYTRELVHTRAGV
jgi:phenylacetaldehyde dehydrogenase